MMMMMMMMMAVMLSTLHTALVVNSFPLS